jgi:ELWxxDGT repeat protein
MKQDGLDSGAVPPTGRGLSLLSRRALPLVLLLALLPDLPATAQPAFRVADLNTMVPQNSSLYLETGRRIAVLGSAFYFVASDGAEAGAELWQSDGTAAGTRLLKDICPGACASAPQSLTVSNGNLFFTADDGVHGRQLWKSDGTPEGTAMVAEILPPHSTFISGLIDAGGVVYFFADDGVHGYELWTSDGTPAGTHLVKDISPGSGWVNGRFLATTSGHKLLFAVTYGIHWMTLWTTDGSEAGTAVVADLRPGADAIDAGYDPSLSGADAVAAPQGTGFLFAADDGTGTALWSTDGIPGGTTTKISSAGSPHEMTVFQGTVYFAATDAGGVELWKSNGTPGGTARLKDIQPGSVGSDPRELTVAGSRLFFRANDGTHGAELWRSDGTAPGTAQVADLAAGAGDAFPFTSGIPYRYQLSAFGSDLTFFALDGSGLQLFRTNGVTTTRLTTAGMAAYLPQVLKDSVTLDGRLYFLSGPSDAQLWASDGTLAGTQPVVDLVSSTSSILLANGKVRADAFAAVGNRLFFGATAGAPLVDPWQTDGTAAGTTHIASLGEESFSSCRALGNGIVFGTNQSIWSSDGTASGTAILGPGEGNLPILGGSAFYSAVQIVNGNQQEALWKTDGTPAGTHQITLLPTSIDRGRMTVSGGKIFAPAVANGAYSLLVTDGTAGGTVHISGLAHNGGDFSELGSLVDVSGTLFFTAFEYGYSWQLWKSDGTPAGTTMIKGSGFPNDTYNAAYGEAAALPGGPLFFVLRDVDAGAELWKSDGTPAGTVRIADLLPGAADSNPHRLTPAGDRLYFVANDGVHGDEPWVTDGTAAGTHMVADLLPGADSSHPDAFAALGTTLLFSATDGVHGVEAWRTGGRTLGTRMIQDIAPGPFSASPSGFTAAGPNVYFAASDHATGFELWAVPQTNVLSSFADVPSNFWAWSFIEAIAAAGITTGCAPGQYCPGNLVTRAEMAAFLERGLQGPSFTPPAPTGTVFTDVPASYWAAGWIEQLAADGITTGCSPNHYCPDLPVNRSEMAVFLLRARHGGSYVPPHVAVSRFTDVPAGYWAQDWIEQLAVEVITTGCAPNSFCPGDSVGRDQMAAFLARTFHLTAP